MGVVGVVGVVRRAEAEEQEGQFEGGGGLVGCVVS